MQIDKNKFLIMAGPNVIENEEHTLLMAYELKKIFEKFPKFQYVFKTSFDKANRTSVNSYRGLGIDKGLKILQKVKDKYNLPIITDVHEPWQCESVAKIADILQIPAFLCRQTDLIKAVAKTNKIIHVKKGQFLNAQSMIKVVEKFRAFGHTNKIILCERGNMYGYNDLIVDTRNLVWLRGPDNLVSMDITHCLQQPGQTNCDGTVKAGGLKEFIPLMGKIALVSGVDSIFMEVHNNPEEAKCDGPTQLPLTQLEKLLEEFFKYICYFNK
jgi:2-dehydro-3-deoxyphosphooctonate aldolase (KDO 8-P synthase)